MSRRLLRALLAAALALAATVALTAAGVLDGFERTLLDARYVVHGTHATPDVAVVGIDEDSAADLGFPFRRRLHAQAIEALLAAGARAIAYDVQFSTPSTRPADDRALIAAASDPRVVLGTAELFGRDRLPAVIGARQLLAHGGRAGSTLLPVDDDGVWRQMQARVQGLPTLAVLAAAGDPGAGTHPIAYAGPPGTIDEIPFIDVVQHRFDPARVRGRVIVVGATAPSLQDSHPTPFGDGLMAGAEIHANAIQTVLDGYPLRDTPGFWAALLAIAAALLAPLATLRGLPERAILLALAAAAGGVALLLAGGQLAFGAGRIVPLAAPLLALALGTAGAVALTYGGEVRQRRQLRATFERFVAPDVAAELLGRDGATPRLESRRIEATVLFCDLRGFTTLAERLDATQVIAVLNRYLALVSEAVFGHGGTVVSYQGDGVLAVFGAPLAQDDHAARALAAARRILGVQLPALNAWLRAQALAEGPLDAGIGVNTGPVMSGLVGSERRVEYAAVGDATNVAARLQGLGRGGAGAGQMAGAGGSPEGCSGRLFVAASTVAALGGEHGLRLHGEVALRGRREPVTVYVGD